MVVGLNHASEFHIVVFFNRFLCPFFSRRSLLVLSLRLSYIKCGMLQEEFRYSVGIQRLEFGTVNAALGRPGTLQPILEVLAGSRISTGHFSLHSASRRVANPSYHTIAAAQRSRLT